MDGEMEDKHSIDGSNAPHVDGSRPDSEIPILLMGMEAVSVQELPFTQALAPAPAPAPAPVQTPAAEEAAAAEESGEEGGHSLSQRTMPSEMGAPEEATETLAAADTGTRAELLLQPTDAPTEAAEAEELVVDTPAAADEAVKGAKGEGQEEEAAEAEGLVVDTPAAADQVAKGATGEGQEEEEEEEEGDDEFEWGAAKHIFVLSSAGKPVFSLSGDEQRLSPLMGLIQALLSLCADCDSGDEMESISAGSRRFVFLKRGNLVLVAVSSAETGAGGALDEESGEGEEEEVEEIGGGKEDLECESFMRLQLEYLYASILFLLTSKVQEIFLRSPGFDLRGLLGGADTSLRGIIELAEPSRGRGRMLASGVETVWMDPAIRSRVARALQSAQAVSATSGALYAVWLCGEKLVSLAQPRAPSHRLTSRDLLLLANFVATQPALRTAESWTPVCFPRFQETGFLYAYIAFLEDPKSASSPPPPPPPPPPQASAGRKPPPAGSNGSAGQSGGGGGGGGGGGSEKDPQTVGGDSCVILVSVDSSSEQFEAFRRTRAALESRFRSALGTHWDRYLGAGAAVERRGILTKFCTQMQAVHFYYCLRGKQGGAPCVTQCLSSPFVDPELAGDPAGQRRVWGSYTRAALRLRRGSCQEGRVFCRSADGADDPSNGMSGGSRGGGGGGGRRGDDRNGTGEEDLATALFESDPAHSLAYEVGDKFTVMSLFGQREDGPGGGGGGRWALASSADVGRWGDQDELHACFPSSVSPEAAYNAAVRLTAIVRRDLEWLFVTGTGSTK